MTTITVRAQGTATVDEAWERYARPSLWSTWSPAIRGVDVAGASDRIAAGLRGSVHGPAGLRVQFVVTAVDEAARTWSWRARVGPVGLTLHHSVDPEGDGCSTALRIVGFAPVVLSYAAPARFALGRLVRA